MTFTLDTSAPSNSRFVRLDGPLNFRDMGGYPLSRTEVVRSGHLYRSDALDNLTEQDADLLIDTMGIATVIDLRTAEEVARSGPTLLTQRGAQTIHLPIVDRTKNFWRNGETRLSEVYLTMLDEGSTRFIDVIEALSSLDAPAVFHCAAGKDRTGLVAAMVLDLLGADDDVIAADYALTAEIMPAMRRRFDERMANDPELRASMERDALPPHLVDEMLSARASTLEAVIISLRASHGSLSTWLIRRGLDLATIRCLRERLSVIAD